MVKRFNEHRLSKYINDIQLNMDGIDVEIVSGIGSYTYLQPARFTKTFEQTFTNDDVKIIFNYLSERGIQGTYIERKSTNEYDMIRMDFNIKSLMKIYLEMDPINIKLY